MAPSTVGLIAASSVGVAAVAITAVAGTPAYPLSPIIYSITRITRAALLRCNLFIAAHKPCFMRVQVPNNRGDLVPFVSPALRKHVLPYVPATDTQLDNLSVAARATLGQTERLVDLGSGDGRVVSRATYYCTNFRSLVHLHFQNVPKVAFPAVSHGLR